MKTKFLARSMGRELSQMQVLWLKGDMKYFFYVIQNIDESVLDEFERDARDLSQELPPVRELYPPQLRKSREIRSLQQQLYDEGIK
jgi:hypothetical protein